MTSKEEDESKSTNQRITRLAHEDVSGVDPTIHNQNESGKEFEGEDVQPKKEEKEFVDNMKFDLPNTSNFIEKASSFLKSRENSSTSLKDTS